MSKSKYLYAFVKADENDTLIVALTYRDEFVKEGWQSDEFDEKDREYLEVLFDGLIGELKGTNITYAKNNSRKLLRLLASHPDFATDLAFQHYVNS